MHYQTQFLILPSSDAQNKDILHFVTAYLSEQKFLELDCLAL